MEPLRSGDVLAATGGAARGPLPSAFLGVSTDTRSLAHGDLFCALRGEKFDAHEFLETASRRGAAAAIVDRDVENAPLPLIRVGDTGRALLDLGTFHRRRIKAKVVAVTGTNGKTTTKDLTRTTLSARYRVVSSPASFNNHVGLPLTLFLAEPDTEIVVVELGTNHRGEIDQLGRVAEPDVAVITNVSAAHLEGLNDLEGVLEEKGSLLPHVRKGGFAVLSADDEPTLDALRARARVRVVTTGVRRRADYVATMPWCDLDRVAFHLNGRAKVRVPLIGCHNLYNALFALAVAVELGVDEDAASRALKDFEGPPMRLSKHHVGGRLVIDDAYNANPGSMTAAIKTFAALSVPGRKVLVLGSMLELGAHSKRLHREVGTTLSCGEFDLICVVGEDAREILAGAREHGVDDDRLLAFEDGTACAKGLPARLEEKDAILVKGSRAMGLERVVQTVLVASASAGERVEGATKNRDGPMSPRRR